MYDFSLAKIVNAREHFQKHVLIINGFILIKTLDQSTQRILNYIVKLFRFIEKFTHHRMEAISQCVIVSFSDLRLFPDGPDTPHSVVVQLDEDLKTELREGSLRWHGWMDAEWLLVHTYESDQSISGRVDRASATETVDQGSIPDRVKPKTIKIGIYSIPA